MVVAFDVYFDMRYNNTTCLFLNYYVIKKILKLFYISVLNILQSNVCEKIIF
jgi:hypothetical protein